MRWRGIAAVATALALGAVGCGGTPPSEQSDKKPGGGKSKDTQVGYKVIEDANVKGPATPVKGATKGGTITVPTENAPESFDPMRCYYVDCGSVLKLTNRTPFFLDYRGNDTYALVPDIVEDMGQANEDNTEFTFTLKKGVKFEDGKEVKAKDMAFTVRRMFATKRLTDGPVYQQRYFLDGDKYQGPFDPPAKGGDKGSKEGDKDYYKGVSMPDGPEGYKFTVKMKQPFPTLRYYMTFAIFSPVPATFDGKNPANYGDHPVATGPYKFETYKASKQLVLSRNEHWDEKTDPVRHAYPDKFDFKFDQDAGALQEKLIVDKGIDQTSITYDNLINELYPKIEGKEAEKRLVDSAGNCSMFHYLDARHLKLEARKALAVAWNYDGEYKAGGNSPITRVQGATIMNSAAPKFKPYDLWGNGGKGTGDPKKAKKMLDDAGLLGQQVRWIYDSSDKQASAVAVVRTKALKAAGFEPVASPKSTDEIRPLDDDPKQPIDIRSSGWCFDWPVGAGGTTFPAIFDGRLIDPNPDTMPNKTMLKSAWLDKEIDRIDALDPQEQDEEWMKLDQEYMKRYQPVIPVGYSRNASLRGSKIGGAEANAYDNGPEWWNLYVMK